MNGQFHGLLVDRARGTARLFNDRYAARRLYVHQAEDGFYFAAEAKALLAVRPELRRVSARALGELVSCGCVLEDRTLFDGIGILPWGAAWTFRNGALEAKGNYFSHREWEEQSELEDEEYYGAIRDAMVGNLPRYFRETGRIGMSLTAGLDTRIIMAFHRPAPGTLPCYTFGGGYRESRDVKIARRVARECAQAHQVIPLGQEFLHDFPYYAERSVFLTDGTASVSRCPGIYVNRKARGIAPVRMTGNYGDEIDAALCGLSSFAAGRWGVQPGIPAGSRGGRPDLCAEHGGAEAGAGVAAPDFVVLLRVAGAGRLAD